jgi:hypothetical protein
MPSATQMPSATFTPNAVQGEGINEELKIEYVLIYPNPGNKNSDLLLKIKTNKNINKITLEIFTIASRKIIKKEFLINLDINDFNKIIINKEEIKKLSKGIYYYKLTVNDKNNNSKMKLGTIIIME